MTKALGPSWNPEFVWPMTREEAKETPSLAPVINMGMMGSHSLGRHKTLLEREVWSIVPPFTFVSSCECAHS